MYALIEGILEDAGPPTVVLAGGIGYELWLPERHRLRLPTAGERVRLSTHLQVREDEMTLYGFPTPVEREVFRSLLSVNGVGPRVALAVLGDPESERVLGGIAHGDPRPLLGIKGIGRKTAERIVLELEEKAAAWPMVAASPTPAAPVESGPEAGPEHEAALVLESMGLDLGQAQAAVAAVRRGAGPEPDEANVEALVRAALRHVHPPA